MANSDNFILARFPSYTVKMYKDNIQAKSTEDKVDICNAIKRRLLQRYIAPCENIVNKSGFNIMANCCLVIETLESFHRGWNKTPNGAQAFCYFFNRSKFFSDFTGNDTPNQFYSNIRCGILHQGETTGGWKIRRDSSDLIDLNNKSINANKFRDSVKDEIEDYFKKLLEFDITSQEWKPIIKKMKSIIKNCEE